MLPTSSVNPPSHPGLQFNLHEIGTGAGVLLPRWYMAYATPQNMIDRVDVRRLGDLAVDTGVRITASQLLTNTRLQDALDDAAGMIDAALLKGGRYQPTDLLNLATNTSYGNNLLIRLNVNLAYGNLLESRGMVAEDTPAFAKALTLLERLEQGEWIFGIGPVIQAGLPSTARLSANVYLLTTAARRYFGALGYQYNGPSPGTDTGMDLNSNNQNGAGPQ